MGIFDRFRRNRQQSVLPDEVKQYYQAENRQRRGMAALLAVVALVATVAIAAGLFYGGRFVYSKIQGNEEKTTQTAGENPEKIEEKENKNENPGQVPGDSPQTPAPAPQPPAAAPAQPPSGSPAPAPAPAPGATPSLGDSNALPHTGDEGM